MAFKCCQYVHVTGTVTSSVLQCNVITSNSRNILQGYSCQNTFHTLTSLIFLRSTWQGFNITVLILHAFELCHVTKALFQASQNSSGGHFPQDFVSKYWRCSLFMILLRTKAVLLGLGIINIYCAFDQRDLTVPPSLKIPFICNITLRKRKLNVQFQANSVSDQKEKNDNCAVALSRQVKAEAYRLSWCSLPPSSALWICLL